MGDTIGFRTCGENEMFDSELGQSCGLVCDDLGDTADPKVIMDKGNFQISYLAMM